MSLNQETMLARFYARDRASDGRFLTGVTTTGIYCLPSCAARKPRPENVRFFRDEGEARSAGLRPCRRCRPDHFYRRFDPELELAEAIAAEVRRSAGRLRDTAALAAASGVGATRLTEIFRRHHHTTPGAFLLRERIRGATALLAAGSGVAEAGFAAGFDSLSTFHHNFRRRTGISPGAYRALGGSAEFRLDLPGDFRGELLLAYLGRDPVSPVERVSGATLARALLFDGGAGVLRIRLEGRAALCSVEVPGGPSPERMRTAHAAAVRLLALDDEPRAFERHVRRRPGLAPLVVGRQGLRIPRTADPWECLAWAIVGQQVNLAFALALRRTVVELAGEPVGGMRAHPSAAAVAALDYTDLTRRRFSRSKAEYLIDTARLVAGGLDLDGGAAATVLERRLLAVRGLGPWTVGYFLMRGIGFSDCVPVGDAALAKALGRFLSLPERPGPTSLEAVMEPFRPFRSLATFHLWQTLTPT
jgi:AraC family transcriptional regulator, regulatory protein of adaptative response / DNA-3-methyladenine glycosylase II